MVGDPHGHADPAGEEGGASGTVQGPSMAAPSAHPRDLVIAIDGPASSGKSTVGAAVAAALGYRFLDTGLLYRAVTLLALERGIRTDDAEGLARLVSEIELVPGPEGRFDGVRAGGRDVTTGLRRPEVDARVSEVARVPAVRAALLGTQRALAAGGGIVVAGRDIGTVVLPDADVKIFLTASVGERARRRARERRVDPGSAEGAAIRAELELRDAIDQGRAVAPLRPAADAIVLNTEGNAFSETVRHVLHRIAVAVPSRGREVGISGPGVADPAAPTGGHRPPAPHDP